MRRILIILPLLLTSCTWPSDATMTRWAQVAELGIAAASGDPRILLVVFADRGLDATGNGFQDRRERAMLKRSRLGETGSDIVTDLSSKE